MPCLKMENCHLTFEWTYDASLPRWTNIIIYDAVGLKLSCWHAILLVETWDLTSCLCKISFLEISMVTLWIVLSLHTWLVTFSITCCGCLLRMVTPFKYIPSSWRFCLLSQLLLQCIHYNRAWIYVLYTTCAWIYVLHTTWKGNVLAYLALPIHGLRVDYPLKG